LSSFSSLHCVFQYLVEPSCSRSSYRSLSSKFDFIDMPSRFLCSIHSYYMAQSY
jgi:hypothetical protein